MPERCGPCAVSEKPPVRGGGTIINRLHAAGTTTRTPQHQTRLPRTADQAAARRAPARELCARYEAGATVRPWWSSRRTVLTERPQPGRPVRGRILRLRSVGAGRP